MNCIMWLFTGWVFGVASLLAFALFYAIRENH